MKKIDLAWECKDVSDSGEVEGLAAAYGNVDAGGDRILPGAFAESIKRKPSVPMLMDHSTARPVGLWTDLRETDEGLYAKGKLSLGSMEGKSTHALVSDGALRGLSIGYKVGRVQRKGGVREIVNADLWEVSFVAFPMNELATVSAIKSILSDGELPSLKQFEAFLREEGGFSRSLAAAVASKGLSQLHNIPSSQSESGDGAHADQGEPEHVSSADILSALAAQLSA
jgi:hypothetical protein